MSDQDTYEMYRKINDEDFYEEFPFGAPGAAIAVESNFAVQGSTKISFNKLESFLEFESIGNNPDFNGFSDNFDNQMRENFNYGVYENQEVQNGAELLSEVVWNKAQSPQKVPENQQYTNIIFDSETPAEEYFTFIPQFQPELNLEVDNVPSLLDNVCSSFKNNQEISVIQESSQSNPSHSPKEEISQKQNEQEVQILHSKKKRCKKINAMKKNTCEETKNLLNYVMPYLEKNMKVKWGYLSSFKSKENHNSMVFLNALAEEVDGLYPQKKAEFYKEYDKFFKIDLKIIALNQLKLETTYLLLKYGDSFITVIKNPNRFKSIKKAKNLHSVSSGQARSRRQSRR